MSTITKEQVHAVSDLKAGYTLGHADVAILQRLARIALASLEAEPVCYIDAEYAELLKSGHIESRSVYAEQGEGCITLYIAPPAPVSVPDDVLKGLLPDAEKAEFWFEHNGKILFEGVKFNNAVFDACRAAMLQGAEPVSNRDELTDGWVACSERMPDKLIPVMVMYADGEMWSAIWTGTKWDDGTEFPDPHAVTHWQEMPAAPQQEVN